MREITDLKKIQELEFEILRFFKKICDENQLLYYIAYGTLLGAVRHQGFIPWDDDIDVMMPREDYNKLVNILNKENHPYYKLMSIDTCEKFNAPLPKIIDSRTTLIQHYDYVEKMKLGVYIDIFLLDGVTNDYDSAVQCYKKASNLYIKWRRADLLLFPPNKTKLYGILRWLKNFPYKMRGVKYYLMMLKENNSKHSFYKCNYIAALENGNINPKKSIWKKKLFDSGCELTFNGEKFRAPKCYDEILKIAYGNYMCLPPKEKQVSHHLYTLYWNTNND